MLESIKDLKEVNGKPVLVLEELHVQHPEKFNELGIVDYEWFEREIRQNRNIFVHHEADTIAFKMLTKPASEGGDLRRCQLTDLITVALHMLKYFNAKFPCREMR